MFDPTIRSAHLITLYHLWNEKRGTRVMPTRADFDPIEMVPLLPHLYLVDVASGPGVDELRFRYRLIGTSIVALLGRDSTGKWADETLHGDKAPGIRDLFTLLFETKAPVAIKGFIFFIRDKNWVFVEGLLLPLSADGETVTMILVGLIQVPAIVDQNAKESDRSVIQVFSDPKMYAYPDPVIDDRRHSERSRG